MPNHITYLNLYTKHKDYKLNRLTMVCLDDQSGLAIMNNGEPWALLIIPFFLKKYCVTSLLIVYNRIYLTQVIFSLEISSEFLVHTDKSQ